MGVRTNQIVIKHLPLYVALILIERAGTALYFQKFLVSLHLRIRDIATLA